MASPAATAVGIGAIGMGVLLMYSAYTNKPLFGEGGIVTDVLSGKGFPATKDDFRTPGAGGEDPIDVSRSKEMGTLPPTSRPPGSVQDAG